MAGISIPTLMNKLEKMRIIFYPATTTTFAETASELTTSEINTYSAKNNQTGVDLKAPKAFSVMFNPTTFNKSYSIAYEGTPEVGKEAYTQKFKHVLPKEFKVTLLFDSTAVSVNSNIFQKGAFAALKEEINNGVDHIVGAFVNIGTSINNPDHYPVITQIIWGNFRFLGVMSSADVTYKLFNKNGRPIRAEVAITLQQTVVEQAGTVGNNAQNPNASTGGASVLADGKKSPDLTKTHVVKAGDTLNLLALKEYGDEGYYMELARVNGLRNYRKLEPGTILVLPPIKKLEKTA